MFSIIYSSLFYSQNTFEYERTWGTYFGPTGGQIASGSHRRGILFDSQKNMYIKGGIWNNLFYANSYYNQFLLGGGEAFQGSGSSYFNTRITSSGFPTLFGYGTPESTVGFSSLQAIDSQDNNLSSINKTLLTD